MKATLDRYRAAINAGQISPHSHDDGRGSGLMLDPTDVTVPLLMLSFGVYRPTDDTMTLQTDSREYVLVAGRGSCTVAVEGHTYHLSRPDGAFSPRGGPAPGAAVYVPRDCTYTLQGPGEVSFFAAPASRQRNPACVTTAERPWVSRGAGPWRRDVATLISPPEISCNLTVGETYSPPGQWSGTPLHRHDLDDPQGGQSDHEEVYYFQFRDSAPWDAAFGVQLLFDDQGLDRSYRVGPRSIIALPGACHPVVAGPGSDLLYVWGLAAEREAPLGMWDVPDTAFLAAIGGILGRLRADGAAVTTDEAGRLAGQAGLDAHGAAVLEMILREQGLLRA